jgi:hypothetical protein
MPCCYCISLLPYTADHLFLHASTIRVGALNGAQCQYSCTLSKAAPGRAAMVVRGVGSAMAKDDQGWIALMATERVCSCGRGLEAVLDHRVYA